MEVQLTLYVMGGSHRSARALRNLRALLDERAPDAELEVVDVIEHPDRGEAAGIVATPTLVRRAPAPRRRVIGDLSVPEAVARLLD